LNFEEIDRQNRISPVSWCQVAFISRPLHLHRVIGATGQALVRCHRILIAPRLERPVFAKGIAVIEIRPVLKILGDLPSGKLT